MSVAIAEMVSRALIVPEDVRAGASTLADAAGPVSQSTGYRAESVQSSVGLNAEERELACSYRWPGGQVIVTSP
ncbi:hypothetical protein [Gordonia sp. NPDC003950]